MRARRACFSLLTNIPSLSLACYQYQHCFPSSSFCTKLTGLEQIFNLLPAFNWLGQHFIGLNSPTFQPIDHGATISTIIPHCDQDRSCIVTPRGASRARSTAISLKSLDNSNESRSVVNVDVSWRKKSTIGSWPLMTRSVISSWLHSTDQMFQRSSCSGAGWRRFLLHSFQSHFNQLGRVLHQQQIFFAPGVLSGAPSKCPSYFCRGKKFLLHLLPSESLIKGPEN